MEINITTTQNVKVKIELPDEPLGDKELYQTITQITNAITESVLAQRSINGEVSL